MHDSQGHLSFPRLYQSMVPVSAADMRLDIADMRRSPEGDTLVASRAHILLREGNSLPIPDDQRQNRAKKSTSVDCYRDQRREE